MILPQKHKEVGLIYYYFFNFLNTKNILYWGVAYNNVVIFWGERWRDSVIHIHKHVSILMWAWVLHSMIPKPSQAGTTNSLSYPFFEHKHAHLRITAFTGSRPVWKNKNRLHFQRHVYSQTGFLTRENAAGLCPFPSGPSSLHPSHKTSTSVTSWQELAVPQAWDACQSPPIFRRDFLLFLSRVV